MYNINSGKSSHLKTICNFIFSPFLFFSFARSFEENSYAQLISTELLYKRSLALSVSFMPTLYHNNNSHLCANL